MTQLGPGMWAQFTRPPSVPLAAGSGLGMRLLQRNLLQACPMAFMHDAHMGSNSTGFTHTNFGLQHSQRLQIAV